MEDIHPNRRIKYEVQKVRNKKLIKQFISHEEIIEGFTSEDRLDRYIKNLGPHHICYLMMCKSEVAGIAILLNLNLEYGLLEKNTYIVDIGFYKPFRGKMALKLSRMALEEFLKHYQCNELMATIDKTNKAALLNARWVGFEIVSTNESKYFLRYTKNGRQHWRL